MNIKFLFLVIILVECLSCATNQDEANYIKEVEQWRVTRLDSLKGKTGWLNLAGLYWLNDGINTVGADSANQIVFPADSPSEIGAFEVTGDSVYFIRNSQMRVHSNGNLMGDTTLVFNNDTLSVSMVLDNLSWFVIERGSRFGIRLRDYNSPLIDQVNHIDAYPIDAKWRVKATWEQYDPPRKIMINNQVGMTLEQTVPGILHFRLMDVDLSLEPVGEVSDVPLFVMIYDETSGLDTYGSGRYIYVDPPDESGITYIDFNKAYNPPCVFTPFATCLFPHEANRLPIALEAGEKYNSYD